MSGFLHYKYHTHGLKAPPDIVRKIIKEDMSFISRLRYGGVYLQYKVKKVTKAGRVRLARINTGRLADCYTKQTTLSVRIEYGIPMVMTSGIQLKLNVKADESLQRDYYRRDFEKDAMLLLGKRFLDRRGIRRTLTDFDPRNQFIKVDGNNYSNNEGILAYVNPETPLRILTYNYWSGRVIRCPDNEYEPVIWKRDYSAEVTIILSCYVHGIPREIALIIIDLFWKAEYERNDKY